MNDYIFTQKLKTGRCICLRYITVNASVEMVEFSLNSSTGNWNINPSKLSCLQTSIQIMQSLALMQGHSINTETMKWAESYVAHFHFSLCFFSFACCWWTSENVFVLSLVAVGFLVTIFTMKVYNALPATSQVKKAHKSKEALNMYPFQPLTNILDS